MDSNTRKHYKSSLLVRCLAAALETVIEEAIYRIHIKRKDEAKTLGLSSLKRFGFILFGGRELAHQESDPQRPESSGQSVPEAASCVLES